MQIHRFTTLDALAGHAQSWDRLAGGVPFRTWAWLSSWWRHYGEQPGRKTSLYVLAAMDSGDELVGVAPWYLDVSASGRRIVRFLGSGEVCSEYLGVLCAPESEDRVSEAMAEWITEKANGKGDDPKSSGSDRWDLLEWTGVDAGDRVVGTLADRLHAMGNTVHRRPGPDCWRIELPTRWDDYLAGLSKNGRKKARRILHSMFDTGRAVLRTVGQMSELPEAMELLVDLHQRRRRALDEPGCFASPRFAAFHREVVEHLLRAGSLQLHWLEIDGKPAAAEYDLVGDGVVYSYQGGMDPELRDVSPGRLITIATIRWAIENGYRAFDLLRGNEPYKAHWRAEPRPSVEFRIVPNRPAARVRHGLWLAGVGAKRWIKWRV